MLIEEGLQAAAYIVATILFILSLGGLKDQETAKRSIWYGIVGMALAVFATVFGPGIQNLIVLILAIAIGAGLGIYIAGQVQMTEMPQLVAALHSFVGLAAVFIGLNADLMLGSVQAMREAGMALEAADLTGFGESLWHKDAAEITILKVEIFLGIFIGAITFTGSIIAFGKLSGKMDGKPSQLPGGHMLNAGAAAFCLLLGILYFTGAGIWTIILMAIVAGFIGYHLINGIGGADMPVVVSMLNSYSGWAAAAIGFTLSNDLLIVTGALVGSSGAILSYIMCKGMNRSFVSVILGGWGGQAQSGGQEIEGEQRPIKSDEVAELLEEADSVVIAPGYGMAVAQAQQAISELTNKLREQGKTVRFAIHPVAGRMPGHMNVLLAEAKVPYDLVLELEEINDDFPQTDVSIVIGANDIVNPAANDDPGSPIAGMPVLHVWESRSVIVLKRGQGTGYSGIENPLFFKDNTRMYYGDAKESVNALLQKL